MSISEYLSRFQPDSIITLTGPLDATGDTSASVSEPIIFVDGGVRHRKAEEGIVAGDGDSADLVMDVMLNPEKDFSDLSFVLDAIPSSFHHIHLHGFLGGRRDHEMINMGEVYRFLKSRPRKGRASFDSAVFGFASGKWTFEVNALFSIIVLEDTRLTINGAVKYRCPEPTLFTPLSSLGLSNEGKGEFEIHCDAPVYILVDKSDIKVK